MHEVNHKIIYQEEITSEHKRLMIGGLNQHAYMQRELGKNNGSFSFVIVNEAQEFQAGIAGFNYYGCFYIDLFFVKEEARGRGYGSELMHKTEALAKERKCLFIAVNTMDFEAMPFYKKYGFKVEFTREGFEKEVKMFFLRKEIQ